ncbi:MAG: hypothetical protein HY291_09800 [Planctomycetes bacterium]|nr:hypothetical protein [Planctomycetota bacterium]
MSLAIIIKRVISIALLVIIYYQFVPPAKERNRSVWKWFLLGCAACWGPMLLVDILGCAINLIFSEQTSDGYVTKETIERQINILTIGYTFFLPLGVTIMFWTARRLKRLPPQ